MTPEAVRKLLEQGLTSAGLASSGKGKRRISIELAAADVKEAVLAVLQGGRSRFVTIVAVDTGLDIELLYNFSVEGVLVTLRTRFKRKPAPLTRLRRWCPSGFIEGNIGVVRCRVRDMLRR
jgi:hypothetical protein